jgi:hypothetical protein
MAISSVLSLGIKDLVVTVLDRIKLPPEKKAEIELAMAQNAHELARLELELAKTEAASASENIRAEVLSGDAYTRRARPTFLYIVYIILVWNYILLPLIQYADGQAPAPIALPESLFWLFGAGYLGYVGARSFDKWKFGNGK